MLCDILYYGFMIGLWIFIFFKGWELMLDICEALKKDEERYENPREIPTNPAAKGLFEPGGGKYVKGKRIR